MSIGSRILVFVVGMVAGAVYGMVGTVGQASTLGVLPVGLLLAVGGAASLVLAVRLLVGRWAALSTGIGMTAAVVVLSGVGPGGSVIAPEGSLSTLVWIFACPLLAGLIVAWPQLERLFDGRGGTPERAADRGRARAN